MSTPANHEYYLMHKESLLHDFSAKVKGWRAVMSPRFGAATTDEILTESRVKFSALITFIPYIGDESHALCRALVDAVQCLAFFRAMQAFGHSAEEAGSVLNEAILARQQEPGDAVTGPLTADQLDERRRERAAWSLQRACPESYVFTYIPGDGIAFDYGYDFTECAAQKFYHAHGADEFLPHYCQLDFAMSEVEGFRLTRTQCLSTGDALCNHRFKKI